MVSEVHAASTPHGCVENLLDKLPKRGPQAMSVFLEAIRMDYKHVWDVLTAERKFKLE